MPVARPSEATSTVAYEHSAEREQFPWFTGVFVPVFLILVCVEFFIDLHRSIETAGWGLGFLLFMLSLAMSYATLISICVIATNGDMRDGGCYYLISRTLGPEVGGATGITLILAHTTSIAFRLSYAALIITNFYSPTVLMGSARWDRTVWQMACNVLIFGLTLLGIKFVLYLMVFCLAVLSIGSVCFYAGFIARKPFSSPFFTGFSLATLGQNFAGQQLSWWKILTTLGILFPSSNAVMTCANFSGNLNPPRRAIPLGSFIAMLISSFLLLVAFVFESTTFDFTKTTDDRFMSFQASISPVVTYIGFLASCLGTSLSMHTGGSRIIAAMCKDGLLPKFISKFTVNGEQVIPHVLQLFVSLLFSLVDSPDTSTLITNVFFLLPFALVNWAVWTAASAHYPGFRPSFKFYNKYIALIFSVVCIVRKFLVRWYIAIVLFVIFFVAYFVYKKMNLPNPWGTVVQSRIFYKTLKEELNLYHILPSPKTFRPNIILVTTLHPEMLRSTIDFLNFLLHSNGMSVVGRVFVNDDPDSYDFSALLQERDGTYVTTSAYKTFYEVTVAKSFTEGLVDLLLMTGIGLMQPNTLCFSFPEDWTKESHADIDRVSFVDSLDVAEDAVLNAMIIRHIELFADTDPKNGYIDVWWDPQGSGFTLLLAYLLSEHKTWKKKKVKLRVISVVDLDRGFDENEQTLVIANLMHKFRLKTEILTLSFSAELDEPSPLVRTKWNKILDKVAFPKGEQRMGMYNKKMLLLADLVRTYSSNSAAVFLLMPNRNKNFDPVLYMAHFDILSRCKRPFVLVKQNGQLAFGVHV